MLLSEYLETNNIWDAIGYIKNYPFITNTDDLNTQTIRLFGDRILFSKNESADVYDLAQEIISVFNDPWEALIAFNEETHNIKSGDVKVTSRDLDTDVSKTEQKEILNKLSAFNSDTLTTDNGMDDNTNTNSSTKLTGDVTATKTNLDLVGRNIEIIYDNGTIKTVITDVARYLTLDIY